LQVAEGNVLLTDLLRLSAQIPHDLRNHQSRQGSSYLVVEPPVQHFIPFWELFNLLPI
jgi:hypothetical protein